VRSLERTLESAWQVLLTLARGQLSMLPEELLDAHGAREIPNEHDRGERRGAAAA
jgi:V/A-type H+-transporting ATPase subunit B